MKKLSINISLFFVLLTLSSCNDWLDEVKLPLVMNSSGMMIPRLTNM